MTHAVPVANTAHMFYECSGLASNIWNFVRDLLEHINNKPFRLTKMKALYFHQVANLVDFAIIASAKRAILRAVHSVRYPIHPRVGIRFLLTEIVGTADTNVRALRDTPRWFQIKEEATQMWKPPLALPTYSFACTSSSRTCNASSLATSLGRRRLLLGTAR